MLEEDLIESWISLTALIKNNRILKKISFNEAIILNLVYKAYENGVGIFMQELLKRTSMLKSLCNRTIEALKDKGFVFKQRIKNQLILYFNADKKKEYIQIHKETISYIQPWIQKLGDEDTRHFIRIVQKLREGEAV